MQRVQKIQPNQAVSRERNALDLLDRLEQSILDIKPQLKRRIDRTTANIIEDGIRELRSIIIEKEYLESHHRHQIYLISKDSDSLADKALKTWGLHNAIDVAKNNLGDVSENLINIIKNWII